MKILTQASAQNHWSISGRSDLHADVRKGKVGYLVLAQLHILYILDMDMALDTIVPETLEWRHTDEGREYVAPASVNVCPF